MANGLVVRINDKSKSAVCRETVALCAKYSLTVEPAFSGNGCLVIHRRRVTDKPDDRAVYMAGHLVPEHPLNWDRNEVYAVVNLTTTDGVTSGELNLRYKTLVRDFIAKYGVGSEVPLSFAIYDYEGNGLAGDGEFNVKVVEPYYVTEDQSLVMFKGEKGDDGVTPHVRTADGHWMIGDHDTGVVAVGQDGADGTTPRVGANDHWFIGDTDTGIVAVGQNGADGSVCTIGSNRHWYIDGVDTGVIAQGVNGTTPHIGANKHWYIGETDTGINAEGKSFIGDGSYVFDPKDNLWHKQEVWTDPDTGEKTIWVSPVGVDYRPYIDAPTIDVEEVAGGVKITAHNPNGDKVATLQNGADGEDGDDGITPHIGTNGHWFIGTTDTGVTAGMSYEIVESVPSSPVVGKFYFIME